MAEAKLKANDASSLQAFGTAVALSGDHAVVGAPHGGFDPGAAYVFAEATGLGSNRRS